MWALRLLSTRPGTQWGAGLLPPSAILSPRRCSQGSRLPDLGALATSLPEASGPAQRLCLPQPSGKGGGAGQSLLVLELETDTSCPNYPSLYHPPMSSHPSSKPDHPPLAPHPAPPPLRSEPHQSGVERSSSLAMALLQLHHLPLLSGPAAPPHPFPPPSPHPLQLPPSLHPLVCIFAQRVSVSAPSAAPLLLADTCLLLGQAPPPTPPQAFWGRCAPPAPPPPWLPEAELQPH